MAENEAENQAEKKRDFPRYAKGRRCRKCGGKLEIAAFTFPALTQKLIQPDVNARDIEEVTPCLVCEGKDCGILYDIAEYGLTEENILKMED